jgi:hypothetical protein
LVEEESYILYVRSRMTDGSYSTTSRSNGYYRGRTAKKTCSFIVWFIYYLYLKSQKYTAPTNLVGKY